MGIKIFDFMYLSMILWIFLFMQMSIHRCCFVAAILQCNPGLCATWEGEA